MKRMILGLGVLLAVMTGGVLANTQSAAAMARFSSGDATDIKSDEVVDGSAYVAGNSVTVEGVIRGDLYCAGKTVKVTAQVDGDIICAGQTVEILGKSGGDMRLAGEKVTLRGESGGSVSVAADSFTTEGTTKVAGDLGGMVNAAYLAGSYGRDVALGSATTTIVGSVGRDVEGEYKTLRIAEGAQVRGNLSYTSQSDADINGNVTGQVTRAESKAQTKASSYGSIFITVLMIVIGLLLVSLFVAMVLPRPLQAATDHAVRRPVRAVIWGLALFAFVPISMIFLMVSGVGLPLGVVLLTAWVLLILLSGPFVGYLIGAALLKKTRSLPLRALLGGLILVVLYMIPILNIFVMLCVMIFGTGMILSYFESQKVYQRRA